MPDLLPNRTGTEIPENKELPSLRLKHPPWSADEDRVVTRLYPDYAALLKALPHRTLDAIRTRVKVLRIAKHRNNWLGSEIAYLRRDDGRSTSEQLHQKLRRHSVKSINVRRNKMGLLQPPARVERFGLCSDIAKHAKSLGLTLSKLSLMVSSTAESFNRTGHRERGPSLAQMARAVQVLGGELYADWED